MQGESADAESGQFDGVQQGHLGHAVCFCATAGPVLVTLNLEGKEDRRGVISRQSISEFVVSQLELQEQQNTQSYTASLRYSSAHGLPLIL